MRARRRADFLYFHCASVSARLVYLHLDCCSSWLRIVRVVVFDACVVVVRIHPREHVAQNSLALVTSEAAGCVCWWRSGRELRFDKSGAHGERRGKLSVHFLRWFSVRRCVVWEENRARFTPAPAKWEIPQQEITQYKGEKLFFFVLSLFTFNKVILYFVYTFLVVIQT